MKTIQFITTALLVCTVYTTNAQVSVNVNIGAPPVWAPAGASAEFYYLPEIQTYYDVRATQFIYFGGGHWVRSRQLPVAYRNYDLHHGRTVVLTDYHGHSPYVHHKAHKVKYCKPHRHVDKHHGKGHGHGRGHGHGHGRH